MFDRISDAAERLAGKVSRRDFFGALGRWAGAAALAVAGVLISGKEAQAGAGRYSCCVYMSVTGQTCGVCAGPCPQPPPGWQVIDFGRVPNCKQCGKGVPCGF